MTGTDARTSACCSCLALFKDHANSCTHTHILSPTVFVVVVIVVVIIIFFIVVVVVFVVVVDDDNGDDHACMRRHQKKGRLRH